MNDVAISVKNITKVYSLYDKPIDRLKEALNPFKKSYHHDFYALKDVSFDIKKGETVGIIGKNGAGKSTLLKIITGVLTPTSGDVEIKGKIASLLELGAGFNPEMTGIENIYLNGTIMGFSKEEMDQKVDAILEFADIGEFIYQPVKMYSSGMFARLAFSVAINVEPDILIVDEALSVGDMAFQNKCFRQMDSFVDRDKVMLFVSHSLSAIRLLCDKVVWLSDGKIIDAGDTEIVTQKYEKFMQTGMVTSKVNVDNKKENNRHEFVKDRYKSKGEILFDSDCYLSDIRILNSNNYSTKFKTYDNLNIELLICNLQKTEISIGMGIAITRGDSLEIVRINNIRDDIDIIIPGGYSRVALSIKELNLLDGEYYLSFFLSKSNLTESYHKIENLLRITVETPYSKCGWKIFEGVVSIPHKWDITI